MRIFAILLAIWPAFGLADTPKPKPSLLPNNGNVKHVENVKDDSAKSSSGISSVSSVPYKCEDGFYSDICSKNPSSIKADISLIGRVYICTASYSCGAGDCCINGYWK